MESKVTCYRNIFTLNWFWKKDFLEGTVSLGKWSPTLIFRHYGSHNGNVFFNEYKRKVNRENESKLPYKNYPSAGFSS